MLILGGGKWLNLGKNWSEVSGEGPAWSTKHSIDQSAAPCLLHGDAMFDTSREMYWSLKVPCLTPF